MQRFVLRDTFLLVPVLGALCMLVTASWATAADVAAASPAAPRVINVTSDSAPGWLPSVELEQQARATANDYLADMDGGRYAEAYALLADGDRKDQSIADFTDRVRQFNAHAGAVIERRIVTVTWTKDPAQAEGPGVYVALDLVSRFANIDRDCGYLVLYQAPSGGPFQVMREESNLLDNATAARMSAAEADQAWAKLSANCPGYQAHMNPQVPPAPLPEATGEPIGYPTVSAALAALHAQSGVVFTTQDGWTIATDASNMTLWSFPPPGNPAYPAAVKRHIVVRDGTSYMDMAVQCEATKSACDDLVRSFEQLNAEMAARARAQSGH